IAGGVVAGIVAPRFPFGHAAGVLLFLAIDTASVLAKGTGARLVRSCRKRHSRDWRSVWWVDHHRKGKATRGRFGSSRCRLSPLALDGADQLTSLVRVLF